MSPDTPAPSSHAAGFDLDLVAALARRLDRPLVLVGMMGVGKSSLGRRLAALLAVPFADADDEIEAAAHMSIPEIFATFDEAYFRAGERRVIARLMSEASPAGVTAKVIATGGGAFCHAETRALILRQGIAVWLDADVDTLVERTARKDNRPLLQGGNRREILTGLREERQAFYAQAPVHVKTGNGSHQRTMMQVCSAVMAWLDTAEGRAGEPS